MGKKKKEVIDRLEPTLEKEKDCVSEYTPSTEKDQVIFKAEEK